VKQCELIRELIYKKKHEVIGNDDALLINDHTSSCEECRRYAEKLDEVKVLMNKIDSNLFRPSGKSKENTHMQLVRIAEEKKAKAAVNGNRKFILSFAALAALLFIITFSIYFPFDTGEDESGMEISRSEVAFGKAVTITLTYKASKEIENADITINLGDAVSFDSSYEEINVLRKHSFSRKLKRGDNSIPFVVKVAKKGRWKIDTRADFEGFSYFHRVELNARDKKIEVVYFELPRKKIDNAS